MAIGTWSASAFYRIIVSVNYLVKDITQRNAFDTAVNNVIGNANMKRCNLKIFNSHCSTAIETHEIDVPVKEYVK